MPVKLLVLDDAVYDIQEAIRYYNRQQAGLGRKFEKEVRQAFRKIKSTPQSASFSYDTIRYKVIDKFPFIVLYEEQDENISVLRVFNTHQDPDSL